MAIRLRSLILGTALLAGLAGSAAAEECAAAPAILSLSATVLDGRESLTPIQRRRFGAEAAYLTIRYAPLDDAKAEALLMSLRDAGVHGVDDLVFAWAVSVRGIDGANELLGDDAVNLVATVGGLSAMRALVLGGNGQLLIDQLAALPPENTATVFLTLLEAIVDLPDATKAELAGLAMDKGMPLLAGGLAAAQRDRAAWAKFVATAGDASIVDEATLRWRWIPALVGNPALPRTPEQGPVTDALATSRLYDVVTVAAMEPQADFLMTVLNETGWVAEVAAAADKVRAAILEGRVPEKGPLDASWRVAYEALLESVSDKRALASILGGITSTAPGYPRESVLAVVEMMTAVDALAPYVSGKAPPILPPPLDPSAAATWETVERLAKALQAGTPPVDDATLPFVAQLLVAVGKTDELAALLAAQTPSGPTLALANDMAERLDRSCSAYLWHAGEALILNGAPIFKFD